jgi:hypothetical protein
LNSADGEVVAEVVAEVLTVVTVASVGAVVVVCFMAGLVMKSQITTAKATPTATMAVIVAVIALGRHPTLIRDLTTRGHHILRHSHKTIMAVMAVMAVIIQVIGHLHLTIHRHLVVNLMTNPLEGRLHLVEVLLKDPVDHLDGVAHQAMVVMGVMEVTTPQTKDMEATVIILKEAMAQTAVQIAADTIRTTIVAIGVVMAVGVGAVVAVTEQFYILLMYHH